MKDNFKSKHEQKYNTMKENMKENMKVKYGKQKNVICDKFDKINNYDKIIENYQQKLHIINTKLLKYNIYDHYYEWLQLDFERQHIELIIDDYKKNNNPINFFSDTVDILVCNNYKSNVDNNINRTLLNKFVYITDGIDIENNSTCNDVHIIC